MIKRFQDISSSDVSTCGGKGASLGELMNAGFPFANGFVLTTEAFGKNHHEWKDEVYKAFDTLNCKYVAVRSSATKEDGLDDSFAGQFDTYLFVDRENLIEQIMACHASIHSDRIIAYCSYKHINRDDIKVAVVIQKMINSEVAGVAFTVNPVTNIANEIVIEGGYGLGEAVVSGMITPDNYVWDKLTKTILSKTISSQTKRLTLDLEQGGVQQESIESTIQSIQKLSDRHIQELAEISTKIEDHYGKPMDIEWALENGDLYILQARPITTLQSPQKAHFTKVLERDLMFFSQGVYARCMHGENYLGIGKNNPHKDLFIIYEAQGYLQFRENALASQFFIDEVSSKNQNGVEFIESIIQDQRNVLSKLGSYRKLQSFSSDFSLKEYVKYMKKGCANVAFYYRSGADERNSEQVRKLALQLRAEDDFFAHNDAFLRRYFKHLGYEESLSSVILVDELDNIPDKEVLKSRAKNSVLVNGIDCIITSLESYAKSHPEYVFNFIHNIDKNAILHGQIAYQGKARGYVKVVRTLDQANQVKDGDILVTSMTTPDFMGAMTRASGFVTDEGGVMCHASIIARELQKPCIIGTKIGTTVLHNGDLVELDATTGTVTILEKYENTLKNTILKRFNEPWIKRRAGSYTFLSCSYRGKQYYKSLQESLGVCFHQTLFTHRKGVVSFFVKKQEFETLGKTLAQRTQQHKNEAIARLEALKKNTDIIMDIMERYEGKILTLSEYKEFLEIFDKHLGYHNFMKKTVDFLSPELLDKMLPHFKEARIYSEAVYSRTEAFFRSLAAAIAKKEGGNAQLITCLTQEDLEQYIANGILPLPAVLQERFDASALFFDLGKEQVSCGHIVDEMENTIAGSLLSDTITGTSVYPGKVQGICRIVADPFNPGIFNEGDILVTGMTRPEYLPLVLKCAAFVTDAGGVLSHAAITARELQKPCIIGTETATKILKNGDLIEVDATQGIVTIL